MRIFYTLTVLALASGFVFLPSICNWNRTALATKVAASSSSAQDSAGQFGPAATTFTVNSILDNPDANPGNGLCNDGLGNCTLRAAIMEANAFAGADTINFNIAPAGPKALNFVGPLPPITEAVTINGTSQPGFSGTPIIELRGTGVPPPLLRVQAPNCIIRGLVVNRVDGNAIALIGDNNKVVGCFIGTDLSGNAPGPGNSGTGVVASGSGATIGGTLTGDPNVIAFNATGVSVGGVGNAILSNSISNNTQLGIDLNGDGPTANDLPCDADNGPNGLQNFPSLTGAQTTGSMISIQGTLNSTANSNYQIEFFANGNCHATGFGEGARFIGSTNVTTDAGCKATFNINFSASVAVGQFVTATATQASAQPSVDTVVPALGPTGNDTSEFSQCVPVVAAPSCMITCPGNVARSNDPNQCGAVVIYPDPMPNGACGAVTCSPGKGAFFPIGTTVVTCTEAGGASCQFNVTVIDNTPPRVTCPAPVTAVIPPGQSSTRINYPDATATDNCPGPVVQCSPPSGSVFPAGTTFVTCTATDASSNTASCVFGVTALDTEAPLVRCPANVSVDVPSTQCSAMVSYPAPTVSDNVPGATVACVPPSGSTFSVGVTVVTCTAIDLAGNRATCSFNVTLTGGTVQAVISPTAIDLKAANVLSVKTKKRVKTGEFSITNTGCGTLRLVFKSIKRVTDQAKFANTDDSVFFSVFSRAPDGSPTGPNLLGQQVAIDAGAANQRTFIVRFAPSIPGVTGKTSGLSAADVLPDSFQSVLAFDGISNTVTINARVRTAVKLIDPVNPQNSAVATLCRSGNQFMARYWVYDASKSDVKSAKYEFLDGSGNVITTIDVDLAGPLGQSALVNGQSFAVENAFTGANDNSNVTSVRITVSGADSSDTVTSEAVSSTCAASSELLLRFSHLGGQSATETVLRLSTLMLDAHRR